MASPNTNRTSDTDVNDLYSTPRDALQAAWEEGVFDKYQVYYDPCDGLGDISDFLESKGKKVYRGDLIKYPNRNSKLEDFLEIKTLDMHVDCIIFNPPFKMTEQFVDKALSLCDNLIMFNRATTLETRGRSEKHLRGEWPLETFWSFGNRVSCTKGVEREATANAVWYGWFKYSKDYRGEPTIKWLFS